MTVPLTDRSNFPARTLESIEANYKAYIADGSRKSRAKDVSCSVIAMPVLMVPVDHVSLLDSLKSTKIIYC